MSVADFAKIAGKTGGPIGGYGRINAQGAGPSFGTHLVDVEVDPETGRVTILRYTVAQDAGKAVHPSYVEGQFQGGAVQGVGWALNEEYIYGKDGKLQNAGFLDYRMPVASDLPMIDAIIVRRARHRRDTHRPAHGRHRQCHRARHRHPLHRAADVTPEGAEGSPGQGAQHAQRQEPEGLHQWRGPHALIPAMARVVLVGNLAQITGGVASFDLAATSVKHLFELLSQRHPALAPHLAEGVAVAIDGQIFQDTLHEPIDPDSEVYVLPQIAGG